MGNCAYKGSRESLAKGTAAIRVITPNRGVMELHPPITVEHITNEFPSHNVYNVGDPLPKPLLHNEELAPGKTYSLRPFNQREVTVMPSNVAQYRLTGNYGGGGGTVWKVKLAIGAEELREILSSGERTEELIESVRTVVKCGNGSTAGSSAASSDQWSLTSSRKANLFELN